MAKHLVWDWNGTLLDDFSAIVDSTNTTIATVGGPRLGPDEHRERFFRPIKDFYSQLAGRILDDAEFSRLDKMFHDHYLKSVDSHALSPGALTAIGNWAGTQSLLSMWFHDELVPLVTRHGLTKNFARIDGLRETVGGNSKHPHLLTHLTALGVEASECVLIGDSVDDQVAASQAGAACVLYAGGFTSAKKLRQTGVPVAATLDEAVALAQQA